MPTQYIYIYKSLKHRVILNSTFIDVSITLFITVTSVTLVSKIEGRFLLKLLKFRVESCKSLRTIDLRIKQPSLKVVATTTTTTQLSNNIGIDGSRQHSVARRWCFAVSKMRYSRRWPDVRNVYLVNRTSTGVRYLFIIRVNIIVIQTTAINSY